jgi:hypothetical protein
VPLRRSPPSSARDSSAVGRVMTGVGPLIPSYRCPLMTVNSGSPIGVDALVSRRRRAAKRSTPRAARRMTPPIDPTMAGTKGTTFDLWGTEGVDVGSAIEEVWVGGIYARVVEPLEVVMVIDVLKELGGNIVLEKMLDVLLEIDGEVVIEETGVDKKVEGKLVTTTVVGVISGIVSMLVVVVAVDELDVVVNV